MSTPTLPQKSDLPAPATPAPTTPVPPQVGPAPAGESLIAQYQALSQQLAGLQAQRRVLLGQVGSPQPAVATTARAQLTQIEAEIARVSVERAGVLGQINARTTQPGIRPPFDYGQIARRGGMNSGDVTAISMTFILAVLMPISIGVTRRLLRRNPKETGAATQDVIAPRLDRLEQAVDAIAIEVERIAEGQRFVTKVMAERPAQVPARTALDPAEASPSALGEAKPFLALGAGPIEPIRVAERQTVRQSITPH
jgi:hypothetical protein